MSDAKLLYNDTNEIMEDFMERTGEEVVIDRNSSNIPNMFNPNYVRFLENLLRGNIE